GWPGNVREMENMIHGLVITSDKPRINSRDIPIGRSLRSDSVGTGSLLQTYSLGGASLKEIVGVMEKDLIEEAVTVYGSIGKAAEVLGVDRSTIFRKIRSAPASPGKNGKKKDSRARL
ncbi:MAG: hypothetical protein HQK55_00880, partial [Deltaproteobacteria bacterium]|nr:hypothetical protein [Deltaproteobacteria bacterium]